MALYPRSDFASVTVPVSSGGCGQPHTRPVINGAPQKEWILECSACETFLRRDAAASGFRKQRTVNEDAGMKLADRYLGVWGTTWDTVPETPDEEKKREHNEQVMITKNAASQTQTLQQIGEAVRGNSDLMAKFLELQIALAKNSGPAAPTPEQYIVLPPVSKAGPEANPYTAESRKCQDCDTMIVRQPGQKGALPWRCPEHKAAKAAARRKVA